MSSIDPGISNNSDRSKKTYEPKINNDLNPFNNDIVENLTFMQKIQVNNLSFLLFIKM